MNSTKLNVCLLGFKPDQSKRFNSFLQNFSNRFELSLEVKLFEDEKSFFAVNQSDFDLVFFLSPYFESLLSNPRNHSLTHSLLIPVFKSDFEGIKTIANDLTFNLGENLEISGFDFIRNLEQSSINFNLLRKFECEIVPKPEPNSSTQLVDEVEIDSIELKGNSYSFRKLTNLIDVRESLDGTIKTCSKIIYSNPGVRFLCGVNGDDIKYLSYKDFNFEIFFSEEDIGAESRRFIKNAKKLIPFFESKRIQGIISQSDSSDKVLKANTPVEIFHNSERVAKIFSHHLSKFGFEKTDIVKRLSNKSSLSICLEKTTKTSDLVVNLGAEISKILTDLDINTEFLPKSKKYKKEELEKSDVLISKLKKLRLELKKKQEELQRVSSLNALQKYEVSRSKKILEKIELMKKLLLNSLLFEDDSSDFSKKAETSYMFSFDQSTAVKLNKSLKRIQKKVWLNLEDYSLEEGIVQWDSKSLENALDDHNAIFVTTAKDREKYLKQIQDIKTKTENKVETQKQDSQKIEVSEEINKIQNKIAELQDQLLWSSLLRLISANLSRLIVKLKESHLHYKKLKFSLNNVKKVRFIGDVFDNERLKKNIEVFFKMPIQQLPFSNKLSLTESISKNRIWSFRKKFESKTNLEKLIVRENLKKNLIAVEKYVEGLLDVLMEDKPDALFIDEPFEIVVSLAQRMRKNKFSANLFLILSETLQDEKIEILSRNEITIIPQHKNFIIDYDGITPFLDRLYY